MRNPAMMEQARYTENILSIFQGYLADFIHNYKERDVRDISKHENRFLPMLQKTHLEKLKIHWMDLKYKNLKGVHIHNLLSDKDTKGKHINRYPT